MYSIEAIYHVRLPRHNTLLCSFYVSMPFGNITEFPTLNRRVFPPEIQVVETSKLEFLSMPHLALLPQRLPTHAPPVRT